MNKKGELFIYGNIGTGGGEISANVFNSQLKIAEQSFAEIDIRINSGGGNIFEGFAIFNAMRNSKAVINIFVDGIAASMGSVIALAGKKVLMSRNAMFMTHRAKCVAVGNANEIRQSALLLEKLEAIVCEIYANKTGLSIEAAKAKYLNESDLWMSADEALKDRIIDGIYDAPVMVSIPASSMKNESELVGLFNAQLKHTITPVTFQGGLFQRMYLPSDVYKMEFEELAAKDILNELKERDFEHFRKVYKDAFGKEYLQTPKAEIVKPIGQLLKENEVLMKASVMGWDALFESGLLPELKVLDYNLFRSKYKEEFQKEYQD